MAASALAIAVFAPSSAHAVTYFWDSNNGTAGFGTATGTWADPNAGTATSGWSTSSAGTDVVNLNSLTPTTSDTINFGNGATGLAVGTITVSGTVNSGDMTFASGSGAIVLSGGTAINLAAASTITVNNATDTISSVLAGAGTSFTKAGTGILVLNAANTFTGATTVNAGSLTVNGAAGSINTSSAVTVGFGATLNLDNTAGSVDRILNSATLTLNGGTLVFTGGGSTASTTETIGTLAIGAGGTTITLTGAGAGQLQTLSAATSFSRTGNGTALIRGTSLQTAATNATRLLINGASGTGLTLIGGGTAAVGTSTAGTTKTLSIVPYLIGDTSASGFGSSFLTYDTTAGTGGGLRPLAAGEYNTLSAGYTTPGTLENVNAFSGTITAASPTVNSLRFNVAANTLVGSGTLTVNSGAIAATADTGIINGFTGIALGSGSWNEGILTTATAAHNLTINVPITINGNGVLTKAGAGIVTIANTIGAGTSTGLVVNSGTLRLSTAQTFTGGITLNGGSFGDDTTKLNSSAMNSNNITVNGTAILSVAGAGTGNITGGVLINSSSVLRLSSSAGTAQVDGVLTGTGTLDLYSTGGSGSSVTLANTANTFTGGVLFSANNNGGFTLAVNSLLDSASPGAGNIVMGNGGVTSTQTFAVNSGAVAPMTFTNRQFEIQANASGQTLKIANNSSQAFTINSNLNTSSATGTRTLTLGGTGTGVSTFAGNITNGSLTSLALTKADSGTWIISGNMSMTGGIAVNQTGTIKLSGTNTYSGNTTNGVNNPSGSVYYLGMQALSPNSPIIETQSGGVGGNATWYFLDGTASPTSRSTVNLTQNQGNTSQNSFTVFVGNDSVLNGGTSSSTTTGSTIQLGNMNFTQTAVGATGGTALIVNGANGYKLQINNVNVSLQAAYAANWNTKLQGDGGALIVGGNVQQLAGATSANTTLQLDGSNTGNSITGNILNSADGTPRLLSLTKAGAGTWSLSGTNSYTGTTTVSAGKLLITGNSSAATGAVSVTAGALGGNGGSLGGAVTVSSAGGMDLRDGSVGTLTLGSTLGITGAAGANNLYFDLGNGTGTSDQISVASTTTVTTTGSAVINLTQLNGLAGRNATTYTLVGGAGTLDATNFAKFSLATTKAFGQTYQLLNGGAGGDLQLQATNSPGTAGNVTLQNANPSWTSTANFSPANLPDYQSNVTVNSAIGTTGALNASQDINSLNYGTSATTATTITPGTAAAGTPFNMLVIEAAAVNGNTAGNGITLSNASGTHTISANIGLASSQTWTVTNASAGLTVSGVISDFGLGNSLTKAGAGTLTISTAPTYTGATTIGGGTLDMSGFAPTSYSTSSITFSGNSTLKTGASTNLALPNMTVNSGVTATLDGGSGGANTLYTMSALTAGSSTSKLILVSGGGSGRGITFGSLAAFTGTLEYNLTSAGGFSVTTPDLADTASTFIRMSTANTTNTTLSFNYSGSSNLTLANRQFELFGTTANTTYNINNNGTGTFTIGTSLAVTATGNKILALGGTNTGANSIGNIPDGPSGAVISVTKNGTGNWALNGTSNAFTGTITLSGTSTSSGTLSYASASGTNPITFAATTGFGSVLSYTGSSSLTMSAAITASALTTGGISIDANGTTSSATINYSSATSLSTTSTNTSTRFIGLGGSNTGDNTFAGAINNNTGVGGNTQVSKNGAGKWVLTGSSNFTGGFFLNQGTVSVASIPDGGTNSPLGANTRINLGKDNNDGILIYTGSGNSTNRDVRIGGPSAASGTGGSTILNDGTTGALTFTATTFNIAQTGIVFNRTLTLGGSNTSAANEIQGIIQNNTASTGLVSLVKSGNSTWNLSGSNTYTGPTTVNQGTLRVNGTHTGASTYTVNTGGTLGGTGTITTAGNAGVTVAAGGKLAPGASIGTLTMNLGTGSLDISGAVAAASSQSMQFEIGATGDKVVLSGTTGLNIGTGVLEFNDFTFLDVNGITTGTYTLFDSSTTITGTLGGTLSGTFFNGISGNIAFANSNQDIVLNVTVAPEPSSLTLLGLGAMGLLKRRRRR